MASSEDARTEKAEVISYLSKLLGEQLRVSKRQSWFVTSDGRLSIYMTYSKLHEHHNVWWYGLRATDIDLWSKFPKAFVLFIMSIHDEVLVVPISIIRSIIDNICPGGDGSYKLHLSSERGWKFNEVPSIDLTCYRNNYEPFVSPPLSFPRSIE